MVELEKFPTSESAKEMLSYVTSGWYDKSYIGKWMYQVMGVSMDGVKQVYEDIPAQLFVDTATWGLSYHEQKYGLPIRTELSYEERRKLIRQRINSRVPITPYYLERMIYQQLGLQAEVSDVHDAGSQDYRPDHPNVFRVIIWEKNQNRKVDYGAVERLVNKAKQSHTVYNTIHRQEFDKAVSIYAGAVTSELVSYDVKSRPVSRDVEGKTAIGVTAFMDSLIMQEIQTNKISRIQEVSNG